MSELMKKIDFFHKPGENFTTDGYIMTDKTMDLLAAHKRETGGQVSIFNAHLLFQFVSRHALFMFIFSP